MKTGRSILAGFAQYSETGGRDKLPWLKVTGRNRGQLNGAVHQGGYCPLRCGIGNP